jgi:hypothetical protein
LEVNADRNRLEVGESVQVTARVRGSGNVATLEAPLFSPPGVFEAYDPEVDSRVDRSGRIVRGSKTFSYLLVPRANGNYEIPQITFSYLNPTSGEYELIRSEPIPITVTGIADASPQVATTAAGLPVDDIAPLKLEGVVWRSAHRTPLYGQPWPYVLGILPLLGLFALALWRRHELRLATDINFARKRRAHPLARKHLKRAEELLVGGEAPAFYEELERAVVGFIGNRLNIAEVGLTRGQLIEHLRGAGVSEQSLRDLTGLLEECDRARFAPVPPPGAALNDAHLKAATLIVTIDQSAKTRDASAA